jgi:predicted peptidase
MRLAVLLTVLWAAAASAQRGPARPGVHELALPESGERYTLAIPAGYDGRAAVPLVVALHYGGEVTPFFGRGLLESLVEPALRDLGAIIAAPDAVHGGWANPAAERQVVALVAFLEDRYNIDPQRTLLTGYSMGGMGTWYLAPRHPELFSLALPMAGRPQDAARAFDWTVPMYIIHSRDDGLIPLEPTAAMVEQLARRGASVELHVVEGITHYEVPRFVPYLAAAKPWIKSMWSR